MFGQSDWIWSNPYPQGNSFESLQVFDEGHVFIASYCGVVLKSEDSGASWVKSNEKYITNYSPQYYRNKNLGYATDVKGKIFATTDGGNTWFETQDNMGCLSRGKTELIYFHDEIGFVIYYGGKILKTLDNGKTWNNLNKLPYNKPRDVFFIDKEIGFIVCENSSVLKTIDGGQSWNIIDISTFESLRSIFFIDHLIGFCVGDNGDLFRTDNAGESWSKLDIGIRKNFYKVRFYFGIGYIVGEDGVLLQSVDNGVSWNKIDTGVNDYIISIDFADQYIGYLIGRNIIMKTIDGGKSWNKISFGSTEWLHDIYFPNSMTGFALGSNNTMLKTEDGGNNWNEIKTDLTNGLISMCFLTQEYGFGVSYEGIFATQDGGKHWSLQHATKKGLSDIFFVDSNIGYAVGSEGVILKTDNKGISWIAQQSKTSEFLSSVHFANKDFGCAVGNHGVILKTTNGGRDWEVCEKNKYPKENFEGLYLVDQNSGFIGSSAGTLLYTTDNGQTWIKQEPFQTPYGAYKGRLKEIKFFNKEIGYILVWSGHVFTTNNGGYSWDIQYLNSCGFLNSMCIASDSAVFIAGSEGLIIKSKVKQSNSLNDIPKNQLMDIKIKITGEFLEVENIKQGNARLELKLFNINGQLIQNKSFQNQRNLKMNVSGYSSGIYLVTVSSKDFITTQKIVISH